MDFAKGDAVITMDGDMQHPPALIPKLIENGRKAMTLCRPSALPLRTLDF